MRRVAVVSVMLVAGAGCTILSGLSDLEAVSDGTEARDGSIQPGTDATLEASSNDVVVEQPPIDAGPDGVVGAKNFCDGVTA